MRIGLCFPYTQPDLTRERILAWYRRVDDEERFSSLSCGERVVGSSLDMSATLAAAAAVTRSIRIVPTLYVLPMHSAVWVAKHAATLDVLSGGRVTVTVGVGGREHDYRCMQRELPVRRQARMQEQVAEMRRIWSGELPFEGTEPVGPRPVQPGGPPILAGTMGPRATARAAHWADGVYSWSGNGMRQELEAQLRQVREAWQNANRPQAPQHVAGFWFSLTDDAQTRLHDYVYKYVRLMGEAPARAMASQMTRCTPDAVREALDAYEELGVEECMLNSATSDLAEIDRLLEVLSRR
ncbi:MAG: LLM class flavin-dependent oxidoreductase [Proteobacteria bacterium]|nr:LLM class flavin-dependent oxidoreductase [Pseudomonadota bacterium]